MKILLITDKDNTIGGAEHYFFDLKKKLSQQSDIEIYSIGFGAKKKGGDDYFILKSSQSNLTQLIWRLFFNPFVYLQLRRKIRQINPDVIHIHNIKQYTVSLLKAIKPYTVVQTVHDYSIICPLAQNIHQDGHICSTGLRASCFWQHRVRYNHLLYLILTLVFFRVRRQLRKIIKHYLAPSPLLVSYLDQHQFSTTHYIPPFINKKKPPVFTSINPFQFLFAGNLGTHKGIYLLMDEFAIACKQINNLQLVIAGEGPEREKLKKYIFLLGLEKNIRLVGWQNDLSHYYEKSIALIFPSTGIESFGMVMTEALAHARPVIAANRGTSAWLINDKQNGLLFDPLIKGDLAKRILILAGNATLAKKFGESGYEKLYQFFDNEKTLRKILKIYQSESIAKKRVHLTPS